MFIIMTSSYFGEAENFRDPLSQRHSKVEAEYVAWFRCKLTATTCIDAADKPRTSPALTGYRYSHQGYFGAGSVQVAASTDSVQVCADSCTADPACYAFSRAAKERGHTSSNCYHFMLLCSSTSWQLYFSFFTSSFNIF